MNLFARAVRNLNTDGRLPRDAIDEHRFRLHREAQVVREPGDLRVLHAGVRLEFEGRHDRSRMDLRDGAFDGELAAFLFEQARAIHQFALVDLADRLRRVEQRGGRQGVVAFAPFGRRLGGRLRVGQRQCRRRMSLSAASARRTA